MHCGLLYLGWLGSIRSRKVPEGGIAHRLPPLSWVSPIPLSFRQKGRRYLRYKLLATRPPTATGCSASHRRWLPMRSHAEWVYSSSFCPPHPPSLLHSPGNSADELSKVPAKYHLLPRRRNPVLHGGQYMMRTWSASKSISLQQPLAVDPAGCRSCSPECPSTSRGTRTN